MSLRTPIQAHPQGCAGNNGSPDLRAALMDPLIHLFLHASSDVSDVFFSSRFRLPIIFAAEELCERRFWWIKSSRNAADPCHKQWLEGSSILSEWIAGPNAFRAPSFWPDEVERSFKIEAPTPWEVANALPPIGQVNPARGAWWSGHDIAVLVGYACGLSVTDLSRIVEVSEKSILDQMISGVKRLMFHAPFELWVMHLDFSALPLTTDFEMPLMQKLKLHSAVRGNAMRAPATPVKRVLSSPVFHNRYTHGIYPRRLGARPVNPCVMICEPRD